LDSLFFADEVRKITTADSLYFSFYFQPGGACIAGEPQGSAIGNQPNKNDSLVLEFGYIPKEDSVYIWNHIWSTHGFNVNEWTSQNPLQYFKQVMIPITNVNYLCESFRFRFRNYASLEPQQGIQGWEGNVDQWHIDYIRLDVNRSYDDFYYTNDLTFVSPTTSFLKDYQAMPWKQFRTADMASHFTNQLANMSGIIQQGKYQYTITQKGNTVATPYNTGNFDINPYFSHGINHWAEQASPSINYSPSTLSDTTTFLITHIFQNSAGEDLCLANDTCVFEQKFYDYYAYDDGTAEYGYCLNNQFNIAKLAMKFSLHATDSLRAVQMWFNHTKNNDNMNAVFTIVVWKDDNGKPSDEKLCTLEGNKLDFENDFFDFKEYPFKNKIKIEGNTTFWIGFEQQGNVQLNIGFDQNNDSREFFKYNTTGTWEISAFRGTPMIRPAFGEKIQIIDIKEYPTSTTKLAPNPTKDQFQIIHAQSPVIHVEIYDINGKRFTLPQTANHSPYPAFDISHLPEGLYFVKIYHSPYTFETLKLIKY
jgi:hypothetical protein